jgi:hypothetical protein
MPYVKRLTSKCNTDNYAQLASDPFWHKLVRRACSANSTCTDGCLFVQELRTRNPLKRLLGISEPNPPSKKIFDNDAVIFSDGLEEMTGIRENGEAAAVWLIIAGPGILQ